MQTTRGNTSLPAVGIMAVNTTGPLLSASAPRHTLPPVTSATYPSRRLFRMTDAADIIPLNAKYTLDSSCQVF